jgi:hypothetical protein
MNERGQYGNYLIGAAPPHQGQPQSSGGYGWLFALGLLTAGLFAGGKSIKWIDRLGDRYDDWRNRSSRGIRVDSEEYRRLHPGVKV